MVSNFFDAVIIHKKVNNIEVFKIKIGNFVNQDPFR